MTVLDGRPETASASKQGYVGMKCPECGQPFAPVHPNQMFCSTPHRKDFLNRQTVRGAVLTPLVMAARITRGGSRNDIGTGVRARQDAEHLINKWVDEDRKAGRMSMVDYVALRYRKGFASA